MWSLALSQCCGRRSSIGAYSKESEESNGAMTMMDMLVADLDKEITEMEVEEKDAQAEYEKLTSL